MRQPDSQAAFGRLGAHRLAHGLLAGFPDRWRHTMGVAARAQELGRGLPPADREALVASAWLHDIGYAPPLRDTGFHPLDGARHLRALGWPPRVHGLVAHHSGALLVARFLGLDAELATHPQEHSPVADALTYADQTIDSHGDRIDLEHRLEDMLRRHGPDSPNARVHDRRGPQLRAIAERVEHRLAKRADADHRTE